MSVRGQQRVVSAAGHRTMYKTDLRNFDILFRKLLLQVWIGPVHGPPHEILHAWKNS